MLRKVVLRVSFINGFTLLELLISLSIVAILVSIAVPAMGNLIESSRSKAIRKQLQSLLGEARSYALTQSEVVTICSLAENLRCAGDFDFPLTMFSDSDRNAILDGDESILRVIDITLPPDSSLNWNRRGYIRYWPSGGTGALTGSLSYCQSFDERYEFRLVVARTGRVRVDYEETRCD